MLLNACKKAVGGDSRNTRELSVYIIVMKLFSILLSVWEKEKSCLGWVMIEKWIQIF